MSKAQFSQIRQEATTHDVEFIDLKVLDLPGRLLRHEGRREDDQEEGGEERWAKDCPRPAPWGTHQCPDSMHGQYSVAGLP